LDFVELPAISVKLLESEALEVSLATETFKNFPTLETFHIIVIHGRLSARRITNVSICLFERMSFGKAKKTKTPIGSIARAAGDQRHISVVLVITRVVRRIEGRVARINVCQVTATRGKREALVINPRVPYFRDHRYQNRPVDRPIVAVMKLEALGK
jgi:hypothetical protein